MRYIDAFRDSAVATALKNRLNQLTSSLKPDLNHLAIMEVCGSHTMAISRHGIRTLLPRHIDLISGPGCPVCVTDAGYIDTAIKLAQQGAIIASFGDMILVPGSKTSLATARAEGANIHACYSPLQALQLAQENPDKEIVFLAIGFETTIPTAVSILDKAIKLNIANISLLTAFKCIMPALEALVTDPDLKINAFICPPHVSAIIGANAYAPFVEQHKIPCVIAGFEPLDILYALTGVVDQLIKGEARVDNQYSRVVKPAGNLLAQQLMIKYLQPADANWRGLGLVGMSGLDLRPEFANWDALKRFGIKMEEASAPSCCNCGEIIKGKAKPPSCPMFSTACTPDHPLGPCMVSSEGSCAAYFKYVPESRKK